MGGCGRKGRGSPGDEVIAISSSTGGGLLLLFGWPELRVEITNFAFDV